MILHRKIKLFLRRMIIAASYMAAAGVIFMMVVTCLDIVLRRFSLSVPGAYDLVRIGGGITIAMALPLTTAVKGHVAIEYFFHRMGRRGRIVVDSCMRTIQILLFLFATCAFSEFGYRLMVSGEVTPTLQCPTFWISWLIGLSCLLTALISLVHLLFPRELLIRL